jgi:hypothetical protein
MALPTKLKTWLYTPCVQVPGTGNIQTIVQPMMLGIKNAIKAMSGVTVKGSSNSVAGAMDGVDRWTLSTNLVAAGNGTAHSWVVLTLANMGGVDLFIGWDSTTYENCRFKWSPSGAYAGGNATTNPSAADEQDPVTLVDVNSNQTQDRRYSVAVTTDGSALWWWAARASTISFGYLMQLASSVVAVPATWSPAVFSWSWSARPTAVTAGTFKARATGSGSVTNVTGSFGYETFNGQGAPGSQALSGTSDMNGSTGIMIQPLSFWSSTATAKGKYGNVYDLWYGLSSAADGDTYPNDATRQFVQVGPFVYPWDGSALVLT